MFSTRRSAAASSKAAQKSAQKSAPKAFSKNDKKPGTKHGGPGRAEKRAEKRAAKAGQKAASQVTGKVGTADRLAAARAAAAAVTDGVTTKRASRRAEKRAEKSADKYVWAPGEKPSPWDLSEWSLRRKIVLVLAVPVILAAVFGGLRINTERQLAANYAATASQVTVLGPAVDYLSAAEHAAVVARTVGINDPRLDEAQQGVVEAGAKLVEARDNAQLTPTQLRQVNDVISLSEQMRTGMAYVSVTSTVSQVRQLERGITQVISTIIDEQTKPEPALLVLAQALDGRLSLSLQDIQVANSKTISQNPVELYTEFGVELGAIDRLAIALGQTDPRVLEIRQANAQRVVNARGGNTKVSAASYDAYDVLIDDLLTDLDDELATSARNAKVLTWVDSLIIGGALLAAIILALLVSRLLLNPIRRVRTGALEVAHQRLPEAVAKIRAGQEPDEIVPIGVTTHEETGQLARAVDDLHRQAVKLASGEAELRTQVGDMFVTLSRRNTSLINQQLGLIETLESDEEDPQRLESLFRLDHLAARMRRNAESLVILSGAPTRATEQDDLSLTDVLQAAIAGVQDYRRVQLDAAPAQRVSGEAAADVVHLLAELVDNSLSYSPPSSKVLVTSSFTRGGVIVQVTDAGLGIAEDVLAELNEKLRSGGEVTPDTARRMGLFVVSRLAQRHGLTVLLDQNDRMGVTATVFLPTSVLSDTARLEAGSGGAQVIELGASQASDFEDEYDVEAEVVEYRRPEPEPAPEPDPITAAINAYGLPQRRPGASGAGAGATTPVSMGGGFFDRVEPDEADEVNSGRSATAGTDGVVDAVLAEEHAADVVEAEVVGAHEEEERAPIALGPVAETAVTVGTDEVETDEVAEVEAHEVAELETSETAEVAEIETSETAEVAEIETSEVAEVEASEVAEVETEAVAEAETSEDSEEHLEHVADVEDHDDQGDDRDDDRDDHQDDDVDQDVADQGAGEDVGENEQDELDDEVGQVEEDHLAPVLATLPLRPSIPFDAQESAELLSDNGNGNGNGHSKGNGSGLAARLQGLAAAARSVSENQSGDAAAGERLDAGLHHGLGDGLDAGLDAGLDDRLDDRLGDGLGQGLGDRPGEEHVLGQVNGAARTPASMEEDETPIFRSLRSNWLSSDSGERPWANSEVDAGWDAADRVEAAPPTRLTETGLPVRRPGNRLIPGGLSTPTPVQTVRDPEAIRARLAAHAAGVSRGRNAAGVTDTTTQEADPA